MRGTLWSFVKCSVTFRMEFTMEIIGRIVWKLLWKLVVAWEVKLKICYE